MGRNVTEKIGGVQIYFWVPLTGGVGVNDNSNLVVQKQKGVGGIFKDALRVSVTVCMRRHLPLL